MTNKSLSMSRRNVLKAAGISRSEFFQRAARLYLKKVSARSVAENLDRVYGEQEDPGDVVFRRAALSHLRDLLQDEK